MAINRYFLSLVILLLVCSLNAQSQSDDGTLIYRIHQEIFEQKCNNSSCHGETFEPNLKTVESSYFTLVYHPVTKNDDEGNFNYRVIPYDTANSILYVRITECCFVNDNDRMPVNDPNPLTKDEIGLISEWILKGAPDIFGKIPVLTKR